MEEAKDLGPRRAQGEMWALAFPLGMVCVASCSRTFHSSAAFQSKYTHCFPSKYRE